LSIWLSLVAVEALVVVVAVVDFALELDFP
jgi:hypothetical protein